MLAKGSFDVALEPQTDDQAPAGRMIISKTYNGDLQATALGQMISKRTEHGAAVYSAIEEVSGVLSGRQGAFTLFHNGYMSSDAQRLSVVVVEGSGSGELTGISGELTIIQSDGQHLYEFEYKFD